MANQDDVRRIAMALPGAIESTDRFAFSVDSKGRKGFAWVWLERIDPKKARVPQPKVLAVRVADQTEKAALLAADPDKFFTEPHYNGYPAVLVRLLNVSEAELRQIIVEAWRCIAPRALVAAYDADDRAPAPDSAPRKAASPSDALRGKAASSSASKRKAASRAPAKRGSQRAPGRTARKRADRRR